MNACDADTVDGQGTLALFISLFSVNRDEDLGLEDWWEEGGRKLSVPNPMSWSCRLIETKKVKEVLGQIDTRISNRTRLDGTIKITRQLESYGI